MIDIFKRHILTEKYPHSGLKDIIKKKIEFVALKEYEQAAIYRDKERNFYIETFGYDIINKDMNMYKAHQKDTEVYKELEKIFQELSNAFKQKNKLINERQNKININ